MAGGWSETGDWIEDLGFRNHRSWRQGTIVEKRNGYMTLQLWFERFRPTVADEICSIRDLPAGARLYLEIPNSNE